MATALQHRYVTVDGLRVHYVAAGHGPPVVLVHGLGVSHLAWEENLSALAQGFTVYALDLPGHGESDKAGRTYTLETGVQWLMRFLDALGLERTALVGNSLGGLLTLKMALDYPQRISRLALVDAAGLGREVALFIRLASVPLLGELLEKPVVAGTRAVLHRLFYEPRFATEDLVQKLARLRATPGAWQAELQVIRHGVTLLGMRRRVILLDRLPALKMPVLLVWGLRDAILPVRHAYAAFRALPQARLVVYPGCGHWPQKERAQEFNQLVQEFLREGERTSEPCPFGP